MSVSQKLLYHRQLYNINTIDVCSQAVAVTMANSLMRGLYHAGVWISSAIARTLASSGLRFLSSYSKLAELCFQRRLQRFCLIPKLHFCHHLMVELHQQSLEAAWCLSPLAFSVQSQEDFIGRPSRISRRVSAKQTQSLRTLQRVLLAMKAEFHKLEASDT